MRSNGGVLADWQGLSACSSPGTDGLALLLGFGVANFVGTMLTGWLMARSLRVTLALMPALVDVAALALMFLSVSVPGQALLVAFWGLAFGGVPVAWSNWVALSARSGEKRGRHGGGFGAALHRDRCGGGWCDV
jgi:predicted MFS family arabinose efflux permease